MQTTVKISPTKAIVVKNAKGGMVQVDLTTFGIVAISEQLSPDQAEILSLALCREAGVADGQLLTRK